MTVNSLSWTRLLQSWRNKINAWRLVLDWTVLVYLGIPIMAALIYNYVRLWSDPPTWMIHIPQGIIFVGFYLVCCSGQVRTFLESGDQLFLRQKREWIRGLKARGMAYTLSDALFRVSLVGVLFLPRMIVHYEWSLIKIIALVMFSVICKVYTMSAKPFIEKRYAQIKRFFALFALYVVVAIAYFSIVLSLIDLPYMLMLISVLLALPLRHVLRLLVRNETNFFGEVHREQKINAKSLSAIMGQTGLIKKQGFFTPEAPLIFRRSKQLFKKRTPVNILVEQCFKTFFRRWTNITLYLQYISILVFAITFVPPLWLKGTLWVVGFILMMLWLRTYWKEFHQSDFVKMYPWEFRVLMDAETKATFILVLPAYVFITLVSLIIIGLT